MTRPASLGLRRRRGWRRRWRAARGGWWWAVMFTTNSRLTAGSMQGLWGCPTRVGPARSGWRSSTASRSFVAPSTTSCCWASPSTLRPVAARSPPTRRRRSSRQELRELAEHRLGVLEDVAVGVAAVLIAAGVGLALAATILLPGVARVVEAVAVELDGQVVDGPAAVDPAARGDLVGVREGEVFGAEDGEELLLQ